MLKALVDKLAPKRNLTYEAAREILEADKRSGKRTLARREDTEPEMLYYLAADETMEVRALVAANPSTPRQANVLLADDKADEVRIELARKIGRILPDLSEPEASRIRELTIETIEKLAADQLPKIREIVAQEIKSSDLVPRPIVRRLAADAEASVSAPILEYSPLLSDQDLIELIASSRAIAAVASANATAVARRGAVSEGVADAIVATLDIPAIAALLTNPNAQIREDTLDQILDQAESIEAWHQPLVVRPDLSVRAVRRIASFVATALLSTLADRHELDADTEALLKKRVRERVEREVPADPVLEASEEVRRAEQAGQLGPEFVSEAIDFNRRDVVVASLSTLSGYPTSFVNRILRSRAPKAVVALAWKAKLPMRLAIKLQNAIARIPPGEQLLARQGVHFPLSDDEMAWQLTYFEGTQGS